MPERPGKPDEEEAPRRKAMNLRQLADLLGLSQTTVSRALNGYPEVGPATRDRVLAAARAHGYLPNRRARGLATGHTMAVASVLPLPASHEMVNPVFADFISGASEVLNAAHYDLMLKIVPDTDEPAVYREMARRGGVDGFIIHAPRHADSRLPVLRGTGLPFVVHGRFSSDDDSYSWVDLDNARAFAEATRRLIALGHRRIALINGGARMDFARRRADGVTQALAQAGLGAPTILWGEMTEPHGHRGAAALLDAEVPPTAFLAASVIVALGIERACRDRGLLPGRDIAVVAHDDCLSYFGKEAEPRFAAVVSPVRDHGRRVAEALLRLIADPAAGPIRVLRVARFQPGPTLCGPPMRLGRPKSQTP